MIELIQGHGTEAYLCFRKSRPIMHQNEEGNDRRDREVGSLQNLYDPMLEIQGL